MSSYTTNEIRGGMKLLIDGDPYSVIDNEYVKPGKGQAFNRIRVRNLRTGRTVEKSYRSGESIEAADVMDTEMQYLYKDGDFWTFMNPENYDQIAVSVGVVGDLAPYLQESMAVTLSVYEGVGIALELPQRAVYEVVETEPTTKGQTASSSYKPAILSNGVKTAVPPHIAVGTRIVVMTADGSYVERAKD